MAFASTSRREFWIKHLDARNLEALFTLRFLLELLLVEGQLIHVFAHSLFFRGKSGTCRFFENRGHRVKDLLLVLAFV